MKQSPENRKNQRSQCSVPVEAREGSSFDDIQTVDISKDGIGFLSKKEISLNERIAVAVDHSPDDIPTLRVGKVVWVKPVGETGYYRIGMKLLDRL